MKAGVTAEEVRDMRVAWQHVLASNMGELSAGFLLEWWEKEPSVLTMFPEYANRKLADLKTLARIRTHGTHLFLAITGVLANLEDDAVVTELLADLKRDHMHFQPAITVEAYLKFTQMFLTYLTSRLGAAMTPVTVTGFTKLLSLLGSEGGLHR